MNTGTITIVAVVGLIAASFTAFRPVHKTAPTPSQNVSTFNVTPNTDVPEASPFDLAGIGLVPLCLLGRKRIKATL